MDRRKFVKNTVLATTSLLLPSFSAGEDLKENWANLPVVQHENGRICEDWAISLFEDEDYKNYLLSIADPDKGRSYVEGILAVSNDNPVHICFRLAYLSPSEEFPFLNDKQTPIGLGYGPVTVVRYNFDIAKPDDFRFFITFRKKHLESSVYELPICDGFYSKIKA